MRFLIAIYIFALFAGVPCTAAVEDFIDTKIFKILKNESDYIIEGTIHEAPAFGYALGYHTIGLKVLVKKIVFSNKGQEEHAERSMKKKDYIEVSFEMPSSNIAFVRKSLLDGNNTFVFFLKAIDDKPGSYLLSSDYFGLMPYSNELLMRFEREGIIPNR